MENNEKNLQNIIEESGLSKIEKIARGFDEIDKSGEDFKKYINSDQLNNEQLTFDDIEIQKTSEPITNEVVEKEEDTVEEISNDEETVENLENDSNESEIIEQADDNLIEAEIVDEEEKTTPNEMDFEDIYSYSDGSNLNHTNEVKKVNKKFFKKISTRVISIVLAGTIFGSLAIGLSKCKSDKSKPSSPISTTTVTKPDEITNDSVTNNDELDVEVEVNTKATEAITDKNGQKLVENAVKGKDGKYYASKEDANATTGSKIKSGYVAPNGKVYVSKDEYDKKKNVTKSNTNTKVPTTKANNKTYYKASDGTYFESKEDRDKYEQSLKDKNKYYKASDGTVFESKESRDKYEEMLKQQSTTKQPSTTKQQSTTKAPTTTKKLWEANDGSMFESKEDRDKWNQVLEKEKNNGVQKNAYSSKQVQINELKALKQELIATTLTYNYDKNEITVKSL